MLMDLFYNTLPARITHKRRVHFHAFMLDVHNGCMRPRLPAQAIRFYPSHETLQTRRTYYA
jgi:predicted ATPase